MNIQEAKQEISDTLRVYLQKDAVGSFLFPPVRQRPILLMGPPGIGKTAIMEQIAKEQDVALVAYTMTHHTRQSAIGLPRITEGHYGDFTFPMTEYTMSEIIAAVYAAMERTGKQEGILFLDEINCVSETLAPTMLQFLQNKTFGAHRLPEGWLIVAAGNPPEYNKSVREFDIVTLDRIRRIDVVPELSAFLRYAGSQGLHGAIAGYLTLKPEKFYHVSRKDALLQYVTARGWEDLSRLLISYESLNIAVTEEIIGEFLNHEETCRDFYGYYTLYRRYGRDYGIGAILEGSWTPEQENMAKKGDFTERFTVVNLLLDGLFHAFSRYRKEDLFTVRLHETCDAFRSGTAAPDDFIAQRRSSAKTKEQFGLMSHEALLRERVVLKTMDELNLRRKALHLYEKEEILAFFRQEFQKEVEKREKLVASTQNAIENAVSFLTACFGDGQELTLLITSLTNSTLATDFLFRHGSPAYLRLCDRLMCRTKEQELLAEVKKELEK